MSRSSGHDSDTISSKKICRGVGIVDREEVFPKEDPDCSTSYVSETESLQINQGLYSNQENVMYQNQMAYSNGDNNVIENQECESFFSLTQSPIVSIITGPEDDHGNRIAQLSSIVLSEEYTKTMDGHPFLLGNDNGILLFGTEKFLKVFGNATTIYMCATLCVCPSSYGQMYSCHVLLDKTMLAVLYMLLPDKDRSTYITMFQMINNACDKYKVDPCFNQIEVEYDPSIIEAINLLYPGVIIKGYFDHYTQAVWGNVRNLGLAKKYDEIPLIKTLIRRMLALPLANPEDVPQVVSSTYIFIESISDQNLHALIHYMNQTWLGAEARFPIQIWSRYGIPGPYINRHLEGFNIGLRKMFTSAHPDIFEFITMLKTRQSHLEIYHLQIMAGLNPTRKVKKHDEIEEKIENCITLYKSNILSTVEFLDIVSLYIKTKSFFSKLFK